MVSLHYQATKLALYAHRSSKTCPSVFTFMSTVWAKHAASYETDGEETSTVPMMHFHIARSCLLRHNMAVNGVRFNYSRTPVTRTLKGNEKQFELAGFRVIGIDWIRLKGGFKSKGNGSLFELAGLFELSEFELPGFYCIRIRGEVSNSEWTFRIRSELFEFGVRFRIRRELLEFGVRFGIRSELLEFGVSF